ncbi:MAG: YgfZ/GcvT domain-containing protein [Bryobacteraceae bacterium]
MTPGPGYQALRESAAWFDLSSRGVIRAAGEDRARLLHALSTNHIQQLQPGQGCYAFFLTAQGKIIADAYFLCFADHFLLDVEPEAREQVFAHIDHYIIADDVTVEDVSGSTAVVAVEGPRASARLRELGATPPESWFGHSDWNGATVARISATGLDGYRLFLPAERRTELIQTLSGMTQASDEDIRIVRIENAVPRLGDDVYETTLPMETQQTHSLHFKKGCYLGQEIVERVRSRGHVNRLLTGLRLEGTTPPEPRAAVTVNGVECGRITSAVYSPAEGRIAAMAYMRVPNERPGTAITVGELSGVTTPVASRSDS